MEVPGNVIKKIKGPAEAAQFWFGLDTLERSEEEF